MILQKFEYTDLVLHCAAHYFLTVMHFFYIESSTEPHLFEILIICNIMNIFNSFLLNKSNNFW